MDNTIVCWQRVGSGHAWLLGEQFEFESRCIRGGRVYCTLEENLQVVTWSIVCYYLVTRLRKKTIVDPDLNQIPLRIFKMSGSNGYVLVWSSRVSLIIIFSEKALLRIYSLPVCLLTEGTFDYHATNYSIKSNNSFGSKGQIIRCTRFGRRLFFDPKKTFKKP